MENAKQTNNNPVRLEVIRASQIEPKEIAWLWYLFIPYGKVTLVQGDTGDGKSTFMLSIAALLTRGKPLPFTTSEKSQEPITVIYQTTEDDADDTIVPRFIKANGDRERLLFISEKESPLTFDAGRILSHFCKDIRAYPRRLAHLRFCHAFVPLKYVNAGYVVKNAVVADNVRRSNVCSPCGLFT